MKKLCTTLAVIMAFITITSAQTNYYWRATAGGTCNSGSSSGGTGTWDLVTLNWCNGVTGIAWPNTTSSVANLVTLAGTVTTGAAVTTGGILFTKSNYIVTG